MPKPHAAAHAAFVAGLQAAEDYMTLTEEDKPTYQVLLTTVRRALKADNLHGLLHATCDAVVKIETFGAGDDFEPTWHALQALNKLYAALEASPLSVPAGCQGLLMVHKKRKVAA